MAFSSNGKEIITTFGGGMLVSGDKGLIEHARKLATQARDPAPHYQHSGIGYNYRLSNVLAGIGRGQLQVLAERVQRRREIFDRYRQALGDLPGIGFMPEAPWGRCTRWLTVITVDPQAFGADREAIGAAAPYVCGGPDRHMLKGRLFWRLKPASQAVYGPGQSP